MSAIVYEETAEKVVKIIKMCTKIPDQRLSSAYWNEPLTGDYFGLSAIELVYVFLEIEKEFHLQFSPDEISQYQFDSINGICHLLERNT